MQRRFNLDTTFYAYTSADGIPVIASSKEPDEALLVTRDIIRHMLARRPDVRADRKYDPKLFAILAKVYPDHRIPADVYHGKKLRPTTAR